jgi:hypothetical protein
VVTRKATYDTSWSIRVLSDRTEAPFWPDIDLSPLGNKHHEVYNCVQIISVMNKLHSWEEGLIVRLAGNPENPNKYERVGVAANVTSRENEH